jgi:hypothetical protein
VLLHVLGAKGFFRCAAFAPLWGDKFARCFVYLSR